MNKHDDMTQGDDIAVGVRRMRNTPSGSFNY
jgi:hypothetical protein